MNIILVNGLNSVVINVKICEVNHNILEMFYQTFHLNYAKIRMVYKINRIENGVNDRHPNIHIKIIKVKKVPTQVVFKNIQRI